MEIAVMENPVNQMEGLFRELLGYEEGLRNSQQAVLDKQSNVRLFERHVRETMDKIKETMGESNQFQFLYENLVVDFYYPKSRLSVDVPDVEVLPDAFIRLCKEPNKIKIKEYLDNGHRPNWASLKESEPKLTYKILKQ